MNGLDRFCWWMIGTLVAFEIFLGIMHVITTWPEADIYIYETRRMFDVDGEGNLPSWLSSAQFLLLGVVLAAIYCLEKQLSPTKRFVVVWLLCAVGAVLLSADEAARFHEWSGTLLGEAIDASEEGSLIYRWDEFPSYYWPIIYLPVALPAAIYLGWFFYKELGNARYLPILGMLLFLIGAVVLDYFEGAYGTDNHDHWRVQFGGFDRLVDTFLIEELLEMFGVTLILAGCLLHASKLASQWLFRHEGGRTVVR